MTNFIFTSDLLKPVIDSLAFCQYPNCKFFNSSTNEVKEHKKEVHNQNPNKFLECDSSFETESELQKHQKLLHSKSGTDSGLTQTD